MAITITHEIAPTREDLWKVTRSLMEFNTAQVGDGRIEQLTFFARNEDGLLVGAAIGTCFWGWLHVSELWVEQAERSSGLGISLLLRLESEAKAIGCSWAHLDTFSFQARPFYERNGYQVFATLEEFPAPFKRYYLKKRLS